MQSVAIPKKNIELQFSEFYGMSISLQLNTNQKWTITNQKGGYITLNKNRLKIKLTCSAFKKYFYERIER